MAFQTVNVSIDVEAPDDADDRYGEAVVAVALAADDRIKIVHVERHDVLLER